MSDAYDRWEGVISLDVQMVLTATSGRPKHTDPGEQGPGIAEAIQEGIGIPEAIQEKLRHRFADAIDVTIGKVSMISSRVEPWFDWDDLTR